MREPRPGSFLDRLRDRDTPERAEVVARLKEELSALLDEKRVFADYASRRMYSRDMVEVPVWLERVLFRTTPHVVVQPRTADEVRKVCEVSRRFKLVVIPRGIGSWAYGGAVPTTCGIVFDLSLMDQIGEITPGGGNGNGNGNGHATGKAAAGTTATDVTTAVIEVDPGARWGMLDEHVSACGFMLPVTPSNRMATVGGWIATGGYGLAATGRGHIRRWVHAIEVVTIDGEVTRLEEGSDDFDIWFGSEGQYGFITRVWLKLLTRTLVSEPTLLTFESDDDAIIFIRGLLAKGIRPEHAKYLDAAHMKAVNEAHSYRDSARKANIAHKAHKIVPEEPAVLLHFADTETLKAFDGARDALPKAKSESPLHVASYLWNERFHPMRVQVLGPSMLASEHLIPLDNYLEFIRRARGLASRFGIALLLEATPVLGDKAGAGNDDLLSIVSFACDRRRPLRYAFLLLLVQMLTRGGVRPGGRPYGVGIWNVPFFSSVNPKELGRDRLAAKRRFDPNGMVNPRKTYSTRTRFWNIPGIFFRPAIFKGLTDTMLAISGLIGQIARAAGVGPIPAKSPIERWAAECTNCGNCVAVCPAYQVTEHEGTTGRQKLKVGLRALHGWEVTKEQSDWVFQCVYCNACTDICQTGIPLTEAYEEIEKLLEKLHGKPTEKINAFVGSLGTNERYLRLIDSEIFESDPIRGERRTTVQRGPALDLVEKDG